MRSLISLITLIFIFSTYSFGQFQKGTWTINANSAGLFVQPNEYTSALALSTDIGYFPTKRLLIGTKLSYGRSKSSYSILNEIAPSPYARFYFTDKKTKLYGQFGSEINLSYARAANGNPGIIGSQGMFRPEVGLGFSHFVSKNIALEGGINIAAYEAGRMRNSNYDYSYGDFYKDGLLVMPHLGMRLFLNTVDGQGHENSTDYFQSGNYTIGIFSNHILQTGAEGHAYSMSLNYQHFVAQNFSIGASFEVLGFDDESVRVFAPTIECYIPSSSITQFVPSLSVNIFSDNTPINYDFGLKVNTFIQDGISFWIGPFTKYGPQYGKSVFYVGAGVNYFIQGRKNSDSVSSIEKLKKKLVSPHY